MRANILASLLILSIATFAFSSSVRSDDPEHDLQIMWNGFWEQGGLPDPVDLMNCFDVSSANLTLNFVGDILNEAANNKFIQARATFINFGKNLPQPVKDCVMNSTEIKQAQVAYGLDNKTFNQLVGQIFTYALAHLQEVHQDAVDLNNYFEAADYYDVGKYGGQTVQTIFNNSKIDIDYGFERLDFEVIAKLMESII